MSFFVSDAPWWWLGGITCTIFIAIMSAVMLPYMTSPDPKKQSATQSSTAAPKRKSNLKKKNDSPGRLEDEPWFPEVEIKNWEDASQLPGCPWCFDGCGDVQEVIRSIWRDPLHTGLQQALSALLVRVKRIRIARVHYRITNETLFSVIYTLNSGAELFGGQPLEMAVGLDLEGISEPGLRRRRGASSSPQAESDEGHQHGFPCLAPFYRIHDGFGCLLSTKHLAVILSNPADTIQGTCFYVYPTRCLEQFNGNEFLLKFARVDKQAYACADSSEEHPHVVFAETNGELTQDDEPPLDFVADTVCNIAGQRVVPDDMGYHVYGRY